MSCYAPSAISSLLQREALHTPRFVELADFFSIQLERSFPGRRKRMVVNQFLVCGKVGPALYRAGFRLNATWVYRWLKNPQAMNAETRMPALGLSDADAKAVTIYLTTLRAAGNPEGSTNKPEEAPPAKPAS